MGGATEYIYADSFLLMPTPYCVGQGCQILAQMLQVIGGMRPVRLSYCLTLCVPLALDSKRAVSPRHCLTG